MSAQQQPVLSAGPPAPLGGHEAEMSPQAEMESLRAMVEQRLSAAVDDILGVFVETVARYREQIELQRRQLDSLRSGQDSWKQTADPLQGPSWIKPCPDGPNPEGLTPAAPPDPALAEEEEEEEEEEGEETEEDGGAIKVEVWDPADGSAEGGPLSSDTDDSNDGCRQTAAPWSPEGMEEAEGQGSSAGPTDNSAQLPHRPPPQFSCKICDRPFQRVGHLFCHATAHPDDCSLCGKHLEPPESLELHLRDHREASFRCGVCGQSFKLRGNLKLHMRIHSGERPFSCDFCGKRFGRRGSLVRHVRGHTGDKPFICKYCGRSFVESGNLKVHVRTHTGEKPYWCSTCNRQFTQQASFTKHDCRWKSRSANT